VHFLFSIDEDVIWPDPAIGCQNDWAVAKATFGLHPFGEIDLPVHVGYLISVSLTVSQHVKYNKTKGLAERVGFEFTRKRSFNNIERTAGNVKQRKTVVSSANGSQTDHSAALV
jgi:hypothetical protein